MTMWLGFFLLALFAVLAVVWRLMAAGGSQAVADDLGFNRALFEEKLAHLAAQRQRGDIDETAFQALQLEYQRQFLADNPGSDAVAGKTPAPVSSGRGWVIIAALLVPLAAFALYQHLGAADALDLRQLLEQRGELFAAEKPDQGQLAALTAQVQHKLERLGQRHRDDPVYPLLLARLYADEGAFELAVAQYQRVVELLPEAGELRAEYAQVLFFAANNQINDEAVKQAELALTFAPDDQTALGILGIASFHGGDYRKAIDYWQRALQQLSPLSASRGALESGIAEAKERLGLDPNEVVAEQQQTSLTIQVTLGAGLQAPPEATVFIYARAWRGSPMPLAIQRLKVADLPVQVVLDESMAMNPAASLATVEQVEVVARISLTGSPAPVSGDMEGSVGPVEPKTQRDGIAIAIDRKIP